MIGELCRQEAIKLFSHKYPYLMMGLVLAAEAAYLATAWAKPAESSLEIVTSPQMWAQGAAWGVRFAVYVILVVGAMGIAHEFSLGTVKTVLVLPIRRAQWVLAKLFSLVLLSWGMLLAIGVLAGAAVAIHPGWGDVVRAGIRIHGLGQVGWHISLACALTAAFIVPLCAFALLVGSYFRSSGAAVGVALLLGILLETAAELADVGRWFFFHHLHRPFAQIVKMGKGLPFLWEDTALWGLSVSLVSSALLAGWLLIRMERMDITD